MEYISKVLLLEIFPNCEMKLLFVLFAIDFSSKIWKMNFVWEFENEFYFSFAQSPFVLKKRFYFKISFQDV